MRVNIVQIAKKYWREIMEDSQNIKNTIFGLLVITLIIFFGLLAMHIIQDWEISKLNDKLDKIEPIIDDYCNSSSTRLDFCGEVLEGYNDVGIKIKNP